MHSMADVTLPLLITALFVTIQTNVLKESYCISREKLDRENKNHQKIISSEILIIVALNTIAHSTVRKFRIEIGAERILFRRFVSIVAKFFKVKENVTIKIYI